MCPNCNNISTNFNSPIASSCSCEDITPSQNSPSNNTGCCVESVNGKTGEVVLSTTDISEGSNKYFTTERARTSINGVDPIIYNPLTGVITHKSIGPGVGIYGDATHYPIITLDAKGHITDITLQDITINAPALDADLEAIAALSGVGYLVRTGVNQWALRALAGASGRINITNPQAIPIATTIDLAPSGVTAGTYGSSTQVPRITVDSYGRVTSVSMVTISGGGSSGATTLGGLGNVDDGVDTVTTTGSVLVFDGTQWTVGTASGVLINNGLQEVGGYIQLGGTLVSSTTVETEDYSLVLKSTNVSLAKSSSISILDSGASSNIEFKVVTAASALTQLISETTNSVQITRSINDNLYLVNNSVGYEITTNINGTTTSYFKVITDSSNNKQIKFGTYPNTRVDTITPLNVLYTDSQGYLCSKPLASVLSNVNIYNNSGALTSNRTLNGSNTYSLLFNDLTSMTINSPAITNWVNGGYFKVQGWNDFTFDIIKAYGSNSVIEFYTVNNIVKFRQENEGYFKFVSKSDNSNTFVDRFALTPAIGQSYTNLISKGNIFSVVDEVNNEFLSINYSSKTYSIGDITSSTNNTYVSVDDTNSKVILKANTAISIKGSVATREALLDVSPLTAQRTYQFPNQSGTLALASNIPVAGNPTGSLGLIAINGSATTFMRSDASPALDVSIAPSWTGIHTYVSSATVAQSTGSIVMNATWNTTGSPVMLDINLTNTASAAAARVIKITRGGTAVFQVDVNGSTTVGSTATTAGLTVISNAGTDMVVGNDKLLTPSTIGRYTAGTLALNSSLSTGNCISFTFNNNPNSTSFNYLNFLFNIGTQTNAVNNLINFAPVISLNANTTSASIIRGIYWNPTLTALQSAQHIPWENTTGNMLFATTSGNVGIGGNSFGGASKAVFISNGTIPSSNPTGGGILYVEAGALKYRGSSGTVTIIANA